VSVPKLAHPFENRERARWQRNAVFLARLHALGADRPGLLQPVDLGPSCTDHLASSGGRQDQVFERAGSNALLLPQLDQEARQFCIWQRGMVRDAPNLRACRQEVIKMTPPPSGVLPGAISSNSCPIENPFDTLPNSARSFRFARPNG